MKKLKTLRQWKHWAVFQYIDLKTLNSIQCQCQKLKHWKPTQCRCQCQFFQCFNVSLNVQCRFADPYCTVKSRYKSELRPCVCRKFSAFRLSRYFDIVQLSTIKTGPKENRGFERPKILPNLPKIFPKIEVRNPCSKKYWNFRNMSKLSKMIEIFGLFRIFRNKNHCLKRPYKRRPSI